MHVLGSSPEDVRRTALLRARYYKLLQDGVVDLFTAAKRHAEEKMGHALESRAHATWAESPTIDHWRVRQAAARAQPVRVHLELRLVGHGASGGVALSRLLQMGGLPHRQRQRPRRGRLPGRDYFALALACSTGILNDVPYSYGAHWACRREVSRRRMAVVDVTAHRGTSLQHR
jgi:hypothetical protein